MSRLLEEVSRDHFPYPPATPEEIEAFEQRVGWKLDPDLRAFYLHCNGAELVERLPDTPYRILPLVQIVRARVAIFGKKNDDEPATLGVVADEPAFPRVRVVLALARALAYVPAPSIGENVRGLPVLCPRTREGKRKGRQTFV